MKSTVKILKLIFRYKFHAIFSIMFMLSYSVFTVAPAHFTKPMIDSMVDSLKLDETIETDRFVLVGVYIILLLVLKGISYFLQTYLMGSLAQKVIRDLRYSLYEKTISLPLVFFNKQSTGDINSRFTVDFVTLNEAILVGIVGPVRDLPMIVLLFAVMLDKSWQLTLMTLLLFPIVAKLISIFGQQNKAATSKRLNQFGELSTLISETITGIRVVKAFIMEQYEKRRFGKENGKLYKHYMETTFISSYSYPLLEITAGLFGVLLISMGGYLINERLITLGDFTSFVVSFMLLNTPLKTLNGISLKIQEGIAAANRIYDILDSGLKIEESGKAMEIAPVKKEIAINIRRFGYAEKTILYDIDITLRAGTVTALVGSSGSGKTTLANLIPRFYDLKKEEGTIAIDGTDIRDASLKSLRSQIGTVTQEIVLFNDTVKNNISYGDPNCTEEQIVAAAKAGYAHDFIMQMPNRYDQEIGEKGVLVSGGQRQRIAISRALIKNAHILILDEATSALDTESEKEVQAAIENLMRNRTTLVIAHRLSTIKNADVIHVMSDGRIVETGTHSTLLKRNGEYRKLHDMQFQDAKRQVSEKASQ